jgi:hypothetical protein
MKAGFFIILVFVFSCKTNSHNIDIPDNHLISDLIIETIKQDSLDTSIPIISDLVNYYFYSPEVRKDSDLEIPPPPPPPPPSDEKGEPLALQYFRLNQERIIEYTITASDSLYFERQFNNAKNIVLDSARLKDIIPFENVSQNKLRSREYYEFLLPLFNYDKSMVWVQYNYHCPACGHGGMVIFKKINNKWVKINSYPTWEN